MLLSLFGISISLFGIALILVADGSSNIFGLFVSSGGLIVSLIAIVLSEIRKLKGRVQD
ncbi:hypothetical protein ACTWPF_12770 [Oceanobacillus sp. M65]|uniref:hypothetical protein n=1 Tax=Oceanobacillus sp. M65 TaxID=3457435 RepID=UPI003FCE32E4